MSRQMQPFALETLGCHTFVMKVILGGSNGYAAGRGAAQAGTSALAPRDAKTRTGSRARAAGAYEAGRCPLRRSHLRRACPQGP
eukprot:scaffold2580_cov388-Prasinococcus_capsulatus_cf.AAC.12